jgi:hypothetical protein
MSEESKKIERNDRQVEPAELSEQDLDKVAGGGGAAAAEPTVKAPSVPVIMKPSVGPTVAKKG